MDDIRETLKQALGEANANASSLGTSGTFYRFSGHPTRFFFFSIHQERTRRSAMPRVGVYLVTPPLHFEPRAGKTRLVRLPGVPRLARVSLSSTPHDSLATVRYCRTIYHSFSASISFARSKRSDASAS
jgi:hypothetical protein